MPCTIRVLKIIEVGGHESGVEKYLYDFMFIDEENKEWRGLLFIK